MQTDDVRIAIYRSFIATARPPMPVELAAQLGASLDEIEQALHALAEQDVIALIPGTSFVWLAHPFSAAAAPFRVASGGSRWDAICIWDALGILALIQSEGRVETSCPDCGDVLAVEVANGEVSAPAGALVHYGVPARRWYEDVGYT